MPNHAPRSDGFKVLEEELARVRQRSFRRLRQEFGLSHNSPLAGSADEDDPARNIEPLCPLEATDRDLFFRPAPFRK